MGVDLATTFDTWVATGRSLLEQRAKTEWQLADWIVEGRQQFGDQAGFDFLAGQLGIAPRQLRTAAKVAEAFPPSRRSAALPFEVHASLALLPPDDRLPTLAKAANEHWGEREAKAAVVEHRHATAMFDDEDAETRLAVEIIRAWNRAPVESRRYFMELAAISHFAAIDEDTVHA